MASKSLRNASVISNYKILLIYLLLDCYVQFLFFFSNKKGRVTKVTTKGGNDVNVNKIISYETELFKQSNNSSF